MIKKGTKVFIGEGLNMILKENTSKFLIPLIFLLNSFLLLLWSVFSIPFLLLADKKVLTKRKKL